MTFDKSNYRNQEGKHFACRFNAGRKTIEYTKGKLVLGVKFKFHKDKISSPKIQRYWKIFCSLTGEESVISCKLIDSKPKENKITDNEELQKKAGRYFLEIFLNSHYHFSVFIKFPFTI